MKIGSFDTDEQVFIVAEIGNNHEGSFALAQDLVGLAAEAGADAVKFQTFTPEHYVTRADAERLARLRSLRLGGEEFAKLAHQAADLGLIFFSTPFDLGSARLLRDMQPAFKIASGDNTFWPLIDLVAGFAKPMIVSTGLADLALAGRTRDRVKAAWRALGVDPGLALLHCVASYPTPGDQAGLGAIRVLREAFPDVEVGYSDHTLGVQAAIYAVAAGARIVEKHFTLNKKHSDFRDHQLSADPRDLARMVQAIREVSAMLGAPHKAPQPCEAATGMAVRRSIAAGRGLKAGRALALDDLTWVRPGSGMAPGEEGRLLGRVLRRDLALGEIFSEEDLEP